MWLELSRIDYPKSEDIKVVYEVDEALEHKFTLMLAYAGIDRHVMGWTYDEAITLHDKLGFAIQDYRRATCLHEGEHRKGICLECGGEV